jgi:hypothetical protein
LDGLLESLARTVVGLARDLGVEDRLGRRLLRRRLQHIGEHTVLVPTHMHHRVDHEIDSVTLATERHRDRVNQEGHVVGHDLDHGVRRGPPVALGFRVVDPDLRFAGGTLAGELPVSDRRAVKILATALRKVVGRHPVVVVADERFAGSRAPVRERLANAGADRVDQLRLKCLGLDRHRARLSSLVLGSLPGETDLDHAIGARHAKAVRIPIALAKGLKHPLPDIGISAGLLEHRPARDAHWVLLLVGLKVSLWRLGADLKLAFVHQDSRSVVRSELADRADVVPRKPLGDSAGGFGERPPEHSYHRVDRPSRDPRRHQRPTARSYHAHELGQRDDALGNRLELPSGVLVVPEAPIDHCVTLFDVRKPRSIESTGAFLALGPGRSLRAGVGSC